MSTIDNARAKLAGASIPSLGGLAALFKGVPEVIGSLPVKAPEQAGPAAPVIHVRQSLARSIVTYAEVESMDDAQLAHSRAEHEAELLRLAGKIDLELAGITNDAKRLSAMQSARRALNLHLDWIKRETKLREDRAARVRWEEAARKKVAAAEALRDSAKFRAERLATVDAENEKRVAAFKALVREHVGDEVYLALWGKALERAAGSSE